MSDQSRYASPDDTSLPSDSPMNSGSPRPPFMAPGIDKPSEQSIFPENYPEGHPSEVRTVAVHPLSNGAAQDMSGMPVHPLSIVKADMGWTSGEQQLDRGDGQMVDTRPGEEVDTQGGQPASTSEPLHFFSAKVTARTANQVKVLSLFRQCRHCVTTNKALSENLGIPYGTVRHIIRRLSKLGFIRTESYNHAGIQGVEVWYCGAEDCLPGSDLSGTGQNGQAKWTALGQPDWTGDEHSPHMKDRKKEEKDQSIITLSKDQIDELWPSIGKAGLYSSHIREVVSAMKIQGVEEKPEKIIAQSLRFIDWQISQGLLKDKHGNEVLDPVAYWRAAMKCNGFYQKPHGYVDSEVLALQQLTEEEEAKLKAMRAMSLQRLEMEKAARREELDTILRALVDEGANHHLWSEVHASWTESVRQEVEKNPQAIINSPGIAATTRIFLRKLYGWPE